MKFTNSMGFRIFDDSISNISLSGGTILTATISPNSYGISTKNAVFKTSLKKSDIVFLDGVYFALASIMLHGKNIQKNQGPNIFEEFLDRAENENLKVFFLGSTQKTLDRMAVRLAEEKPSIEFRSYSPPFKDKLSDEDNQVIFDQLDEFEPDILFVSMTCPKQEIWSYENKDKANAKIIIPIGAAFDWYSGDQKEIHPIWWKLRLAWLIRTIHRPAILKRYPNIFIFFKHLMLIRVRLKKEEQ